MNLDQLTLQEVEMIERKAGAGIGTFSDDEAPKARLMAAVAWVTKLRDDPAYKFEDAQQLTMSSVAELLGKEQQTSKKNKPTDSPQSV